jgi:hypothetical protein
VIEAHVEQINIRQTPIYNFLRNINPPEFVSPTFVFFFPAKSPSVEEIGNGREKATRSEKVQESREPQAGAAEKPAQYDDGVDLVIPPSGSKHTERVRDYLLIVPEGFAQQDFDPSEQARGRQLARSLRRFAAHSCSS